MLSLTCRRKRRCVLRRELLLPLAVLALGLAAAGGFFAASAALSEGHVKKSARVEAVPREPEIEAPGLGRAFVGLLLSEEPDGGGVRITQVISGSPADDAGLKKGDIITAVDGRSVNGVDDVRSALENKSPGDRVTFSVRRDGQEEEVAVTLGRRAEALPQPLLPGQMAQPYLGVRLADITPEIQKELGLARDHGVAIVEVDTEGPAQKAGLRRGDVILMIGSQQVSSATEARDAILDHDPGDSVSVRVQRGSDELSIEVELDTRPGISPEANPPSEGGPLMPMVPGQGPFRGQPQVPQAIIPFANGY
jgi:S1-C subfamily serine protease